MNHRLKVLNAQRAQEAADGEGANQSGPATRRLAAHTGRRGGAKRKKKAGGRRKKKATA